MEGIIKIKSFTNPITQDILQKKDFEFPSGGGAGGSQNINNYNFQFVNGVIFVNRFNHYISGDIASQDLEWLQDFNIPQEYTSRKFMIIAKFTGNGAGDNLSPNFSVRYRIDVNGFENIVYFNPNIPFNDLSILVPVNVFETNHITITISKNGSCDFYNVSSNIDIAVALI